jgi:hypothetical protein
MIGTVKQNLEVHAATGLIALHGYHDRGALLPLVHIAPNVEHGPIAALLVLSHMVARVLPAPIDVLRILRAKHVLDDATDCCTDPHDSSPASFECSR